MGAGREERIARLLAGIDALTGVTVSSATLNSATLDAASTLGGVSGTTLAADHGNGTSYVPTITAGTGSLTSYTVNVCRYKQIGKWVDFHLDVTITNSGTGGSTINSTLPVAVFTGNENMGVGREIAVTGVALTALASGTTLNIFRYDNAYPGATNNRLIVDVRYETV